MASYDKKFRTRAIAIAAVGAVAVGGVQVTAPTGAVLASGVTEAAAQTAEPTIPASAVSFKGIFRGNADDSPKLGDYDANADGKLQGDQAYMRFTVDVTEVQKGDRITLYVGANENDYSGGAITIGALDRDLDFGNFTKVINIKNTSATSAEGALSASGVAITGLDGADAANGVMTLNIPVIVNDDYWAAGDGATPTDKDQEIVRANQPVKAWTRTFGADGKTENGPIMRGTGSRITYTQRVRAADTANVHDRAMNAKPEGDTVALNITGTTPNTLKNGMFTAVAYPAAASVNNNRNGWVLSEPGAWEPRIVTATDANGAALSQAAIDNIQITATPTSDGKMNIAITGVPKGARVTYSIDNAGFTDLADPARYVTYYESVQAGDNWAPSGSSSARVAGLVDGDGNPIKANRVPTALVRVNNESTSADAPATIKSGKEQTFQFVLGNDGNTRLTRPNLVDPSGKVRTLSNVSIEPGKSQTVEVKYTPAGESETLKWRVEYSNAAPIDLTAFVSYGNNTDGNGTGIQIDPETKKPFYIDPETGEKVFIPTPEDVAEAEKDAKAAKKAADEAKKKADDLQTQLDAEKAKNDADRQKIAELEKDLAQAKKDAEAAAKRAEDAAKKAQSEVDALEKVVSDLKADQAADREKIAGLEKQLEDAKDALKRAQDAATAAQNAATAAQNTANQALADLAKERERIDGLTEDLATERARVDDLTERADKAEKDLADARKRVAALEKQNKDQQAQIDEARADITALEEEAERLNKELEAAKKRVAALEKENKEQAAAIEALQKENKKQQGEIDGLKKENAAQQKQIDGLRKDLTAAEKRISTLETNLAETRKELAAVSERLGVVEDRLNTGIGKCVGTIGGSLLALIPAVALASQVVGGSNIPAIDNAVADVQRQIGAFNPELAEVVNQNRGAIAAGFAGLGLLALLAAPGLCGDASIGGAVTEPLSSARDARKAEREAEKATETPAPKSEEATEITANNGEVVEEDVEVVEEDLAPAGA